MDSLKPKWLLRQSKGRKRYLKLQASIMFIQTVLANGKERDCKNCQEYFLQKSNGQDKDREALEAELYQQIGQIKMNQYTLKKVAICLDMGGGIIYIVLYKKN